MAKGVYSEAHLGLEEIGWGKGHDYLLVKTTLACGVGKWTTI
jgi:hypothetical protein